MSENQPEDLFEKKYNNPSEELKALYEILEKLQRQALEHPERNYEIQRAQERIEQLESEQNEI